MPARRGRGIGSRLLSDFLSTLKEHGIGVALLLAVPERDKLMPDLLRFYGRAGFLPLEESTLRILYRELDS